MNENIKTDGICLFEVREDDHVYKVFEDGRIEGFGENAWIHNHARRYFALLRGQLHDLRSRLDESSPASIYQAQIDANRAMTQGEINKRRSTLIWADEEKRVPLSRNLPVEPTSRK